MMSLMEMKASSKLMVVTAERMNNNDLTFNKFADDTVFISNKNSIQKKWLPDYSDCKTFFIFFCKNISFRRKLKF